MYYAVTHRTVPKSVDDRLLTIKDPQVLEYDEAELRQLHAAVRDPNFRIFTDRETITVFNNEVFVRGTDIQAIFAQLGVDEATHAFYLGRELLKAKLAITLGKTYRQEGALAWGYLTPPDDIKSEHVRLTQRSPEDPQAGSGRVSQGEAPLVEPLGSSDDPIDVCARFLDLPFPLFLDSASKHSHSRRSPTARAILLFNRRPCLSDTQ